MPATEDRSQKAKSSITRQLVKVVSIIELEAYISCSFFEREIDTSIWCQVPWKSFSRQGRNTRQPYIAESTNNIGKSR